MTTVSPKMFLKRLYRRRFSLFVKFFVIFFLFSSVFLIFKSRKKDTFEMLPLKSNGPLTAEDKIFEDEIKKSESMIVPGLGDDGEEVILEGNEKLQGDADIERIALNEHLSKKISLSRTLKDYRDPKCASVHYDTNLPSASVVIVFFNEPLTVLLRTVWSVLNTGGRYVEQVVLVDDCSTNQELMGLLDYYVHTRLHGRGVIIVRLQHRSGLIRARLAGARASRGDVIVFLDAHCECVHDWLRPLLQRIKEERRAAVVPIIDVIEAKTFHYSTAGYGFQVGGFTFSGHFTWIDISEEEVARRGSDIAPTRSPTMAGGLFAMDRRYFWEVGSYDELMDGWGGENLEMSFRIWQCGGVLETIPCSRVGHVFRDFHPYSFPNDKDTHGINTARLALVWMDDYAKLFFRDRPELKDVVSQEDVAHRKVLREKLNCKSFGWYLKNVYPQKFVPGENIVGQGRIMNPLKHLCLDTLGPNSDDAFPPLGLYVCHETLGATQHLSLTLRGELRTEEKCAQIQYKREENVVHEVIMADCHGKKKDQEWSLLPTNQIRHVVSMLCLDTKGLQSGDHLVASECDRSARSQMWRLEFNQRNKFGTLDTEFDKIDADAFGLHGDENRPLPANSSSKKRFKKGPENSSRSVDLNPLAEVLAKPQGFPGRFRVPAYQGLDNDKLR